MRCFVQHDIFGGRIVFVFMENPRFKLLNDDASRRAHGA